MKLEIDNVTAVAYIQNLGGRKTTLNNLTREIIDWARDRDIWLSAAHLPGSLNTVADLESRKTINHDAEWMLNKHCFQSVSNEFGPFDVDLFATRLNFQVTPYVAWRPDPMSMAVDAFNMSWAQFDNCYLFPPFSMVARVLQKMELEGAQGVVIVPLWPTQMWFSKMLKLITAVPLILPMDKHLLTLPQDQSRVHPLFPKMRLVACKLSGKVCDGKAFRNKLPKLSLRPGGDLQSYNTGRISSAGCPFVVEDHLIQFRHL